MLATLFPDRWPVQAVDGGTELYFQQQIETCEVYLEKQEVKLKPKQKHPTASESFSGKFLDL